MIRKLYHVLIVCLIYGLSGAVYGQIAVQGTPASFTNPNYRDISRIPLQSMPLLDVEKLLDEDDLNADRKDIPYRFGYDFHVKLDFHNYGLFEYGQNEERIWRLRIKSDGAQTINLIFDKFKLNPHSTLYIYNSTKKEILGAFGAHNNNPGKNFATGLIRGDEIVLELNESPESTGLNELSVSTVVHGYRSLKDPRDFGSSGGCNNNVICPEADDWRDDIRSSAMIILGNGTRWCSGSLVNNVRQDKKPYFLTANHCISGNLENWIIMFNYESPDCAGTIDGNLTQSVQGVKLLATDTESDFALMLLDTTPPTAYNVYYSGWDANDVGSDSTVAIHHPDGDIKKIAFDYDSVIHSGYFEEGKNHWQVIDWDDGTTEPGSSGSPLFNKHHRIIGQLHGGTAACGNDDEDYYGKISHSWDSRSTPEERLQDWLDPNNSGTLITDGRDFNAPSDSIDLSLCYLNLDGGTCSDTGLVPSYRLQNLGADTIFKATVYYEYNDTISDSILWTGSLAFNEFEDFTLPGFSFEPGNNTLRIYCSLPNDSMDAQPLNDTIVKTYFKGNEISLSVTTDFFGEQTQVFISSDTGTFYTNVDYLSSAVTTQDFCLPNGCYELIVVDLQGNGMCCGAGQGSFRLSANGTIVEDEGRFLDSVVVTFCVTDSGVTSSTYISSVEDELGQGLTIFPNPTNGSMYINGLTGSKDAEIQLFSATGKLLVQEPLSLRENQFDLSDQPDGIYYLIVKDRKNFSRHKVVLIK